MIRSMTGFGAGSAEADGAVARVELRSTNHRHLQVKWRLPSELNGLEQELDGILRGKLARGAVTAHVSLVRPARADDIQLNTEVVQRYASLLTELAGDIGSPERGGAPRPVELIQLPGVLGNNRPEEQDEGLTKLAREAATRAVDALCGMRESEGEHLEQHLREHARAIAEIVENVEARMPDVVRTHHENLKQRLDELLEGRAGIPDADLARELAMIADRLDVREETDRLGSHLAKLEAELARGGAVGRKLDFLAQEFLREANTIGSKCSDASVAHEVVELKTHIERLREQVQNVE